jgi:hypothetical protein
VDEGGDLVGGDEDFLAAVELLDVVGDVLAFALGLGLAVEPDRSGSNRRSRTAATLGGSIMARSTIVTSRPSTNAGSVSGLPYGSVGSGV